MKRNEKAENQKKTNRKKRTTKRERDQEEIEVGGRGEGGRIERQGTKQRETSTGALGVARLNPRVVQSVVQCNRGFARGLKRLEWERMEKNGKEWD